MQPFIRNFKSADEIQCVWHMLDHQNRNIIPESQEETKTKQKQNKNRLKL